METNRGEEQFGHDPLRWLDQVTAYSQRFGRIDASRDRRVHLIGQNGTRAAGTVFSKSCTIRELRE